MRPGLISGTRRRKSYQVSWLLPLVAAVTLSAQPATRGRTVSFRADNGRTITALQVDAALRPAPAVVLVPMLGRPRDDWQAVAEALAAAQITALAIDLPGSVLPGSPQDLAEWHTAVAAAVAYLFERPDVRGSAIGIAGASLGANLAALAAASDSRVAALALVSPSLDYRGVRIEAAVRAYGMRPALLLASRADPYAARSVRTLAGNGPGPRETHWSDAPAHGTILMAGDPGLAGTLVDWFRRTLGVN